MTFMGIPISNKRIETLLNLCEQSFFFLFLLFLVLVVVCLVLPLLLHCIVGEISRICRDSVR